MAERPEDFNLPVSVVARLLKETLPEGVAVSKEARAALAKAAAIFVLYTTSLSNNFANKGKRKTVTGQDVMAAMEDMELSEFLPQLQEALEAFRKEKTAKKDKKKAKETSESTEKEADDDAKDDVEMTEEPVSDADVTSGEAATEDS